MISFGLWVVLGLIVGAAPALLAERRLRTSLARQWWWISFGLALVCLILPFGIVLIMFLSDAAFDAIREMGQLFWSDEFRWLTGIAPGWLIGSAVMALLHRRAPRLQGPPMSEHVAELAGDPEQQLEAVERYRRETAVGVVQAIDVVEGFREHHPVARKPLAALDWMYLGFGAAWYFVLGAGFILSLRAPTNHFLTALAFFVFIPGLFGGFCGLSARAVGARSKTAFRAALQSGTLTRRYAFSTGLLAGAASIAAVAAMGYSIYALRNDELGVLFGLAGIGVILTGSPFLGLWLLNKRCAWQLQRRR